MRCGAGAEGETTIKANAGGSGPARAIRRGAAPRPGRPAPHRVISREQRAWICLGAHKSAESRAPVSSRITPPDLNMCNYEFICAPSLLVQQLRSFCCSRGSAALSRALTFNFSPRVSEATIARYRWLALCLRPARAAGAKLRRVFQTRVSARISAPSERLGSESRVFRRRMCC